MNAEIETALAESRRRVEVMYQDRLSGAFSIDTFIVGGSQPSRKLKP